MTQTKQNKSSTHKSRLVFYSTILLLMVFLISSNHVHAGIFSNTKKTAAIATEWCENYLSNNPEQTCKVVYARKCKNSLKTAKKFGTKIEKKVWRACISGGVSKKHSKSYVLQCRGGGSMFARILMKGNTEIRGIKRAARGAGSRSPAAGECAFLDRPITRKEPAQLLYKSKKLPVDFFDINVQKVIPGWNGEPITEVLEAVRNGKLFYVHVRNDRGWMVIRRIGP